MSHTQKLFTVAGASAFNDTYKVRYGNSISRIKIFAKHDVDMVELPEPMTKEQAVAFLKTSRLAEVPRYLTAIIEAESKYAHQATVTTRVPKVVVKKVKAVVAPSLDTIRQRGRSQAAAIAALVTE